MKRWTSSLSKETVINFLCRTNIFVISHFLYKIQTPIYHKSITDIVIHRASNPHG